MPLGSVVTYGLPVAGGLIAVAALVAAEWRVRRLRTRLSGLGQVITGLSAAEASAVLVTDAEGRLLYASRSAELLFRGRPPLAVIEPRLAEADHTEAREAFNRLKLAAEIGSVENVEIALTTANGGEEWLAASVRPLPEPSVRGGTPGVMAGARVWHFTDATARRAIADVLLRERDDLSELLHFLPAGFYSADAAGVIGQVNQALADWLGYPPDALIGQPLSRFIASGAMPDGDGVWLGEVLFVTRTGKLLLALVMQNTWDDGGATRTRSVVVRDARLSSSLEQSEDAVVTLDTAAFRGGVPGILEAAPIGVALLDLAGEVVDCNPAFERITGTPRTAILEHTLHDLIAPEDRGDLDAVLRQAAQGNSEAQSIVREVRMARRPDGAASLSVTALGRDGLAAYMVDATAQRNLEAQFAQAQKMQAMGQLAGGVAHDFNNLLTAMIGFCDLLLQRHGAGDPSFSDIMQVKQNANRAANLVRQLLAFSRKQPLRPRLLEVAEALTELTHLLRRLLGESVQLDIRLGRDAGLVRVDPGQFDQVIINLAVNARDAMPGGGRLSIRTRIETLAEALVRGVEQVPAGEYVAVSVADTGIGIPRENLGRIFEPFFSTKASTAGTGTGLGLATVYGIMRQTGGFVFVDSTPGEGTEFTIMLPRQRPEAAAHDAEPAAANLPPSAPDIHGGETILIVEDEDPVRIFAARALRSKGYTVVEARTGEGALEILETLPKLDLLVTDMVMPGMDGAALSRAVRAARPALRVILISGYSEEAARGELTESPDFHFLPKPFSLHLLVSKVKDVLAGVSSEA